MSDETTRVERAIPSGGNSNAVARADSAERLEIRRRREEKRRRSRARRESKQPLADDTEPDSEGPKRGTQLDLLA